MQDEKIGGGGERETGDKGRSVSHTIFYPLVSEEQPPSGTSSIQTSDSECDLVCIGGTGE